MLTLMKLTLLRYLILWTLSSSDTVKGLINQSYKQNRHEDDTNQPRSVQPWGSDGDKRRYFLIEGQDDTAFRVYRESNPAGTNRTWWSVAGTIEELRTLAEKLQVKDGGPKATKLAQKMLSAVPRFEAGEDVSYKALALAPGLGSATALNSTTGLTLYRNGSAVITARRARNSSRDRSLGFPFMRVELGVKR